MRFDIEIYQKRALSIIAFSWISEILHKYFLQIEAEEEGLNFLLAYCAYEFPIFEFWWICENNEKCIASNGEVFISHRLIPNYNATGGVSNYQ